MRRHMEGLADRGARRMDWSTASYAAAAVLAEWYLLWETRTFWLGCARLWFGWGR